MIAFILSLFIGMAHAQPAPDQIPGCVYRSSTITLSNLQTTAVQCDINGNLVGH